jgi:NAD-dependent deacetylase
MTAEDRATAQSWIATAQKIMVITGAGISTASGIPDYRGPSGVWTLDPSAERTSHIDDYTSDREVRERYWQRLHARTELLPRPNAGHHALAHFEATRKLSVLVTQNIDGLHLDAGTDPEILIEIHGDVRQTRCLSCGVRQDTAEVLARVADGDLDPRCEVPVNIRPCGGILATSIVRFGEQLDPARMSRASRAAKSCDLLICVGSTLAVHPVAGLPSLALGYGARLIIINDAPTDYDREALCLRGDITEILPEVLAAAHDK